MKRKDIELTVEFSAAPREVYEALMNQKKHARFTGGKAVIDQEVGGKFSVYNGDIEGTILELIPNKKIVQYWRSNDWPRGYYSRATFELTKIKNGTELKLTQIGVPSEFFDDIKKGWIEYYWRPMKLMLEKK